MPRMVIPRLLAANRWTTAVRCRPAVLRRPLLGSWVLLLVAIGLAVAGRALSAGPPVAPTDPLTPEEQLQKFHLPPGFEIQLVASEPDIQKPMNLNFDSRGRLWVSHSIEYPWPADAEASGRDSITILDGIGPDGKATKISKFAEELNIPIGVLPLGDGSEAIAWSIPNLWKLCDTDGDGKADEREILFGPYDYVDTHGNQNSLKLGLDGWVYAQHGFRNDSKIRRKGEGPVVLELQSGNTYRFKPDGSEIELFGWGQVNPFGSCFDQWGNLFNADCHSKPVSLVLRGGYIESFGKPSDGLGFTPPITGDDHGSTGIAGIVYYDAPQFPTEYRHNLFVGNVVTNRVHRDIPQWRGSTPWIEKPEDFLVCDDWWFHPVDLQIGPDGALYIADFYNCIIGHYEVDLKHPRRDRFRGRVWRVVWKGLDGKAAVPSPILALAELPTARLFGKLADPNLIVRTAVVNELAQRADFIPVLKAQLKDGINDSIPARHLSYAALRAGELMTSADFPDSVWQDPIVRANWLRAAAEFPHWRKVISYQVVAMLWDDDRRVGRIAVEALARQQQADYIEPLVAVSSIISTEDTLFAHAVKIALRNQFRSEAGLERLATLPLSDEERARLAEIVLAVPTEAAAAYLLDFVRKSEVAPEILPLYLTHVARHVGEQRLDAVAEFVQQKFRADLSQQLPLFQAVFAGLSQKGATIRAESALGIWGSDLAAAVLEPDSRLVSGWSVHPLENSSSKAAFQDPWGVRPRNCADGRNDVLFFDSIVRGEQLTGILRSRPFVIPEHFSFWICGHNGLPETNPEPVNHVRLKLVEGGEVIARQIPPRNDTAQKTTWNLEQWAGRKGVLEVVDADAGPSFAWLGVSRFEPSVVAEPSPDFTTGAHQLTLAVNLVEQLKLVTQFSRILGLLADRNEALSVRLAAARAAMRIDVAAGSEILERLVVDSTEPVSLRSQAAQALGTVNAASSRSALVAAFGSAPAALEQPLALALAGSADGVDALLEGIDAGKASPRLLQDPPIVERLAPRLNPQREERIAELTAQLPPADERIRDLIAERLKGLSAGGGASLEKGAALFNTHCAACHKIGEVGKKFGPQLDGIGQRGAERLLQDILDPNRNVDGAFRATILVTKAGLPITGLKLRDEGQVTVLVDIEGKEQRISADDIDESQLSSISPMPSNFDKSIPEADFRQLLAFLLSQQSAPVAEPTRAKASGGK
ncbi:MAG: c-type cytochrome [Planctomycetaceae bacterium]|nr:c-type cytochrome [Planctomycetaceae bacterium]